MAYKPTDTYIPCTTNGFINADYSKSYKFSITKPTKYPGEDTVNGVIWIVDIEAMSKGDLVSAQQLAGKDYKKDPTGNTYYPFKNNYYAFSNLYDFPQKNPKDGSDLHDPWNQIETRDGIKRFRDDLGPSLKRVEYGEITAQYSLDDFINLAKSYLENTYKDIVYGRRKDPIWVDAAKRADAKEISSEEAIRIYNEIGNREENKMSLVIDVADPAVAEAPLSASQSQMPAVPKIKLNIVGIEDGFQIMAKQDLPDFKIYVGDIPISGDPNKSNDYDSFEDTEGLGEEYIGDDFSGPEEEEIVFVITPDVTNEISRIESEPYVPDSKNILDMIPGYFVTNSGAKIQVCQIDSKPVNVKIAGPYLDMRAAAAKEGIKLSIISAFRSPYDSIKGKSNSGVVISASSQKSLYDAYLAGKGNLAAEPGKSNHGNGIGLDLNTGSRKAKSNGPLNEKVYKWLVKNSWRFGFVRSVGGEEWHFDYLPGIIAQKETGKAYTKLANTEENRFYSDLGLNSLG